MATTATLQLALNMVTQMAVTVIPTFINQDPSGVYPLGPITCSAYAGGAPVGTNTFTGMTSIELTGDIEGNSFMSAGDYIVTCSAVVFEPLNAVTGGLGTAVAEIPVTIPSSSGCTAGVMWTTTADPMPIAPQPIIDYELDLGHTKYTRFSGELAAMEAFPFPRTVVSGTKVHLKCCAGEECTFAFVLYRCEECTGPKPFGMTKQLLLDNWESAACSPRFDEEFATTLFYKNVQGEFDRTYELHHDELFVVLMRNGAPLPVPLCNKPHGPFGASGAHCGAKCPNL